MSVHTSATPTNEVKKSIILCMFSVLFFCITAGSLVGNTVSFLMTPTNDALVDMWFFVFASALFFGLSIDSFVAQRKRYQARPFKVQAKSVLSIAAMYLAVALSLLGSILVVKNTQDNVASLQESKTNDTVKAIHDRIVQDEYTAVNSINLLKTLIAADQINKPIDCAIFEQQKQSFLMEMLAERSYTFSQCSAEIELQRKNLCEPSVDTALHLVTTRNTYNQPFRGFLDFCAPEINAKAKLIKAEFSVPDEISEFLRLNQGHRLVLISPQAISTINGTHLYNDLPLWRIHIQANDNQSYVIYSGDHADYVAAMARLASIKTSQTQAKAVQPGATSKAF